MQPFSKTTDLSLPELSKKPNSRDSRNIRELPTLGVSRTPSQGYPKLGRELNNYMPEDYDRPQSNKVSTEVSKGISYLDVVGRMRDLERKYIDLASSLDRRVQSFIEENPQKILRHLRNIEDKEVTLWKESQQKQLALQDGLDIVKGSMRENNDGTNSLLNQISRRLDENDFKMESFMKGLDALNRYRSQDTRLAITDKALDQEHKVGAMEAEIRVLKEAVGQERQKRESFFNDIMQQYQDINNQLHINGNDILGKFRKHKDDVLEESRRNIDQQRKLEEMRIEKILGDSEYIRSLIRQVENKVEDEVNKRLKHEFENKNWMEQKIALFKQEVKADEKEMLENEKKFLGNIQESMNSLNIIVTNTREQLEANLASTQTLFNDNVKSLSKTIELLKNNVYSKLNAFDTSMKDLDGRVSDTQKGFHEHTITINETLDKEFSRIEKVTMKFEEIMNAALKMQDEKLVMFEENNKLWKKNFEDKNLRVLTEISNALKTLKGDLNKEKLSTVERFDNVKEEIISNQLAAEKLFEQVNDRIKGVETQFEYKIEETFVKANENLRRAVDILDQDIEKMGKTTFDKAKKDAQNSVNAAEQRSRVYTDEEITKAKEELLKTNRASIETLRSEVSKDFQSVNLKLADYQNQRADDMKNLQGEIKYVHDRVTELKDESREGIKRLSEEFDGKLKLAVLNNKNFASDRVKELREEVNKQFAQQSEFVKTEVDLAKAHNGKLINELNDKIHADMEQQKVEINKRFDDLLEEEKKIRATKDTEILNAVQGVKTMLLETINTKIESTQALARALVLEEAAERARSIENLNQTFKRRVEALEKYLKELLATTVEEAKLELKELLRLLEIKFENHKVWTIKELNIIIRDVEEYVMTETVSRYREELFAKVQEKERAEHWRQIEEAFQVVGAKFEDMDLLKRDELEMLDRRLYEMDERNAQDHEAIYQRIEEVNQERTEHTEEVARVVGEQGQVVQEHAKKLQEHEKTLDEHQENMYDMDEKFTNRMEDMSIKQQVQEYWNSMIQKQEYAAMKAEEEEHKKEMKKKFKRVDEQMVLIDERFDENEKAMETFEQKTENNFKIAEKALLAHRDFINAVDARLTVEEMYASILVKNIENKMAAELSTVTSHVDLVNEHLDAQFSEKMKQYQKRLEEDFIQHHVLSLEDKINNMKKELQEADHKTKDQYQQQVTETTLKVDKHEESIKKCQEEIEKAKLDLNTHFDLRAKENGEDTKVKLDELTKRLDDIQKDGFSDEIKQDIKTMIMKDVQKSLDTDVQNLMEKNMQILIEKDISKLIERETNKVVKAELASYEQKLKDVEAKIGKGGAGGPASGTGDAEIKKEVENVKELIAKIQKELLEKEKANTELEKKIENMNANLTGIEKTVKGEIDKTYNNQNVNHAAVTQQLSKLFDEFQSIQTKLDKK